MHVSLRTLHNWETGKVRIPYAAFKLIRLFNSYEIFHPIWKDWRIVGSRLVTPEGHSLEASNFHWLSLMARRSDAFGRIARSKRAQNQADRPTEWASASGLVYNSTSRTENPEIQQIQASQGRPPTLQNPAPQPPVLAPHCNTGGKTPPFTPQNRLHAVLKSSIPQQNSTFGGGL